MTDEWITETLRTCEAQHHLDTIPVDRVKLVEALKRLRDGIAPWPVDGRSRTMQRFADGTERYYRDGIEVGRSYFFESHPKL